MTSTVVYKGNLRTTCTHLKSGSNFETDAPVDNNGKGERFSPTDLMATSLGTCMLTVMGIKARSMGFDLTDMKMGVIPATKKAFSAKLEKTKVTVKDNKITSWAVEPTEGAGLHAILGQLGVKLPTAA